MNMSRKTRQTVGFAIVVVFVILILVMFVQAEKHGSWVWLFLLAAVLACIGLSVKYPLFRSVMTDSLGAVRYWWDTWGSSQKKERRAIPMEIQRQVLDRAANRCECRSPRRCPSTRRNDFHHIDVNPSNNVISNIIYLCPNHHRDAHRSEISQEVQRRWAGMRSRRARS